MIEFNHTSRQRAHRLSEIAPVVEAAATHALMQSPFVRDVMAEGIHPVVDWVLLGPRSMRQLNREQRDIDAETDVLSFPARAMDRGEPVDPIDAWETVDDRLMLGELAFSPGYIAIQAAEYGQSFERELALLTIHGILHLLGYDHQTPAEREHMESLQRRLLMGMDEVPSGFVALVGRPNVGKSTLLNALADRTLAITSAKPQTTRHTIRGVISTDDYQLAFLDTPGLHRPNGALGKSMMKAASNAIQQADVVALMIDASWKPFIGERERRVIEQAQRQQTPVVLVINKIDATPKEHILPLIAVYEATYGLAGYVPISAAEEDGLDVLIEELVRHVPTQPRLFDVDDETDQTERIMASELIRREVLLQTDDEVPYGVGVIIERFDETTDDDGARRLEIDAVILCDKPSHKAILVGTRGQKIKAIGTAAREAIEALTEADVFLSLFVKVRTGWQLRERDVRETDVGGRHDDDVH
ncbi:MAG: GTPase Era [Saccharofermentanales bacterium]|jgi:GTP-binding protein Era/rRNA maturation RNase YbeY